MALLIVLLSLVPPSLRPVTGLPHSLEHLLIFLATGISFVIGYPGSLLVRCIGLVTFAGLVEIAQFWDPGRHARMSDFIVDASAAMIGVGIAWIVLRIGIGILYHNGSS